VVWPEQNIVLFTYLEDDEAALAEQAARQVKARFPKEGMKIFLQG
jgi:hypothetical protein